MARIWKKALESGLDEKDAKLLFALTRERKFTNEEIKEIAKEAGLGLEETGQRLEKLKQKKILLKDRVSVVDQLKIWDGYYIALIKAAIKPPVVGMETKFPTGWEIKDYLQGMRQAEKEIGANIIRHAYTLQGTEWDIFLAATASSQDEFAEFLSKVARQGWVTKTWSFTPVEFGGRWIFDPVASPDPKKYRTKAAPDALWKKD